MIVEYSNDIIVKRFDNDKILSSQGEVLIKHLPNWSVYEPHPNGGKAPAGTYTKLYSPIFESSKPLREALQEAHDGISEFIKELNASGKGISRIECQVEQSDDFDAVPHPSNDPDMKKYFDNGDYKNSKWAFNQIFLTENHAKQTVYLNKYTREDNNVKIIKKYYILRIESSWSSI